MTEVMLRCCVYGEGTGFPVKIALDAEVSALQEKIAGILSTEQHTVPPRLLTLYLARKDGETKWLPDDHKLNTLLRGGVDAAYKKMRPSWKLNKKELFGTTPSLGEENIHVLVERVGVVSETSSTALMVKEMHEQIVQTKRKRYVHSDVGKKSSQGRELLQDLNILVKPVRTIPFAMGNETPVQPFQWESVLDESGRVIKLTEEQQREKYFLYVEDNIGDVLAAQELCAFSVEKGRNILSVKNVPGHNNIELAGRTDLLILNSIVETDRDMWSICLEWGC